MGPRPRTPAALRASILHLSQRLHEDERGIALVVAMLAMMVIVSLGIAVIQLSISGVEAASFDRKTITSVNAADSGAALYV